MVYLSDCSVLVFKFWVMILPYCKVIKWFIHISLKHMHGFIFLYSKLLLIFGLHMSWDMDLNSLPYIFLMEHYSSNLLSVCNNTREYVSLPYSLNGKTPWIFTVVIIWIWITKSLEKRSALKNKWNCLSNGIRIM